MKAVPSISFRAEPYSRSKPQRRLSSSRQYSVPSRHSQEGRIRRRLFHSLGIDPKQSIRRSIRPTPITNYHAIHTKTVSAPFLQPLRDSIGSPGKTPTLFTKFTASKINKCNNDCDYDNLGQRKPRSTIKERRRRIVRFDNSVLVVPIPSRHMYSNRIKKALWRNGNELRNLVDKNRHEYSTEGWDWNKVLEDEDMYIDIATGEKIHPCWVECGDTE